MNMLQTIGRINPFRRNRGLDVELQFLLNKVPAKGSTSVVHKAKEKSTGTVYALKLINRGKTDAFRSRFESTFPAEGAIQMLVDEPGIIKVHRTGMTTRGTEFILMDYVKGSTLDELLERSHQAVVPNVLKLIHQLARSIFAVHSSGFIHRHLCPRNIMLDPARESLMLFDFGLAVPDKPEFWKAGTRSGSPLHMAPEIARRRPPADTRGDIFAFGVTVYQLLTGKHPWGTIESSGKAALVHDSFPATSLLEHLPNANPRLVKAIDKCLAINPDDRMPSMKVFIAQTADIKSATV